MRDEKEIDLRSQVAALQRQQADAAVARESAVEAHSDVVARVLCGPLEDAEYETSTLRTALDGLRARQRRPVHQLTLRLPWAPHCRQQRLHAFGSCRLPGQYWGGSP